MQSHEALACLSKAYPQVAGDGDQIHFKFAMHAGALLIEVRRGDSFFSYVQTDFGFELIDHTHISKLSALRTIGNSYRTP